MMKLILSLTLLWALSSSAAALQCQTCSNVQCSTTEAVSCSSETMCITASIQSNFSGVEGQDVHKACASSSLCPTTGPQTFSSSSGDSSSIASAECCNSDNCNNKTLPFPGAQTVNSLMCYSCNPSTSQCDTAVNCTGNEDHCFQSSLSNGTVTVSAFGCASANLCPVSSRLQAKILNRNSQTVSCCPTSLCNTVNEAFSIKPGLIHLLLGLFIFTPW